MSVITDMKNFLTTNASVTSDFGATPVFGQSFYISHEPDKPDNCITLYPYGGAPPEIGTKEKHNANVQVRVRGTSYQIAYNTCQTIIDEMHYNQKVLGSTNGVMLAIQSAPIYLDRDDDNRVICVCNFGAKYVRY